MPAAATKDKASRTNFSKVKLNTWFTADGEKYRKTSELTYDDAYGMERYIDPFFDRKINAPADARPAVDTSARIVAAEDAPKPAKRAKKPAKKATATSKKR